MSTEKPPEDGAPGVPPPPAGDRTVIASPEAIAAALAAQSQPPAGPDAPAPDPFAAASEPVAEPTVPPAAPVSAPPFAGPVSTPPAFVSSGPGSADALIGVQLNELYEVVRFIAEGGMGRVYEGRNIASGERVAIKVILGQYAADEQFMALFRREASALEKIGHDALVKYRALGFDRSRGINYMAIEYVDGPSMAHALTGQPADPALVKRVLRRLAQGLHAAHEGGVIHRDLSPDNVLMPGGNVERAKIIDFGIAKDNNPGQKSVVGEAFAGKFGYAAPEVFGKYGRRIGAWTDIYSLGLVIAAFARGTPIEMGITIVDALEARDSVPDLSDIPAELQPIIAKMLAPDPADRFQTMEEVADACDPRGATQFMPAAGTAAGAGGAPAFVKADAAPAAAADKPKGKMPVALIAGVVAVVAGGGLWMALKPSGDAPVTPVTDAPAAPAPVAPATTAQAPDGSAALASAADWATSAPQVFAALGQLRCADVRVDGVPQGNRVRLAGWRSSATPLPARVGNWQLDGGGVESVAGVAPQTCGVIDGLRSAAKSPPEHEMMLPARQMLSMAALPHGMAGGRDVMRIDLKPTRIPSDGVLFVAIDNQPKSDAERIGGTYFGVGEFQSELNFEPLPMRYLMVMVSSPRPLAMPSVSGVDPRMASVCAGGACQLTSGWIEVR